MQSFQIVKHLVKRIRLQKRRDSHAVSQTVFLFQLGCDQGWRCVYISMPQPYQIEPEKDEAASARLAARFRSLLGDKLFLASSSISLCLHILLCRVNVEYQADV